MEISASRIPMATLPALQLGFFTPWSANDASEVVKHLLLNATGCSWHTTARSEILECADQSYTDSCSGCKESTAVAAEVPQCSGQAAVAAEVPQCREAAAASYVYGLQYGAIFSAWDVRYLLSHTTNCKTMATKSINHGWNTTQ